MDLFLRIPRNDQMIKGQLLFGLFIFPKYVEAYFIMGFTKPCSHPVPPISIHSHLFPLTPTHSHSLLPTPTHSHPLPSTPIHSHQFPPIPTHCHLLPPTPILHSHSLPPTSTQSQPTHAHFQLLPRTFTHVQATSTNFKPNPAHVQFLSPISSPYPNTLQTNPVQPITYHSNPCLVPVFYVPTSILTSIYFFFCFQFGFKNSLSLQA